MGSLNGFQLSLQPIGKAGQDSKNEKIRIFYQKRMKRARRFKFLCAFSTAIVIALLFLLISGVVFLGASRVSSSFIFSFPSRFPDQAGLWSAFVGSFYLLIISLGFALPVGVAAAIYLEELTAKGKFYNFVELNVANLAGVPSIIFGILGLAVFVRFLDLGRSVLAGGLTLAVLVLPIIIIASREAIHVVPASLRHAAFALGATRWQAAWHHVLPAAWPGILTGSILALSRAIGESAPLLILGALSFVAFVPENLMDDFTALPIQIFNWASRPDPAFHELAAAGIIVLLGLLLTTNAIAIFLRQFIQSRSKVRLLS